MSVVLNLCIMYYNRSKFRSQSSDDAKVGRDREGKSRREKTREERELGKEDAGARKGSKVAKHCDFSTDLWLQGVEK